MFIAFLLLLFSNTYTVSAAESARFIINDEMPNYGANVQNSPSYQLQGDTTWYLQPVAGTKYAIEAFTTVASTSSAISSVSSESTSTQSVSSSQADTGGVRDSTLQNRLDSADIAENTTGTTSSSSSSNIAEPLRPAAESLEFLQAFDSYTISLPIPSVPDTSVPSNAQQGVNSSQSSHSSASIVVSSSSQEFISEVSSSVSSQSSAPYWSSTNSAHNNELFEMCNQLQNEALHSAAAKHCKTTKEFCVESLLFSWYHWLCDCILLLVITVLLLIAALLYKKQQTLEQQLQSLVTGTKSASQSKKFRSLKQ